MSSPGEGRNDPRREAIRQALVPGAGASPEAGAVAAEASAALLATFTELLATLIGAPLTDRLLDPVWTASAPPVGRENC
jgi:hypothetical protein